LSEGRYVFASREWLEAFIHTLNSDGDYNKAAKNWEDPITLVVTNLPPPVQEFFKSDRVVVWLDLWHGQCRSFEFLQTPDQRPAGITLTASYDVMKRIALGQLSPTTAMMTGQLKAKGSVFKLVTNAGATAAFVNAIKRVPTEFLA
jgi:putative sterol carrier protein